MNFPNFDKQQPERNIFLVVLILGGAFLCLLVLLTFLKVTFFTLSFLLWASIRLFLVIGVIGLVYYIGKMIYQKLK